MMKFSKKTVLALAVIAAMSIFTQPIAAGEIEDAAESLLKAEKDIAPTPTLSKILKEPTKENAYKVQNVYVAKKLENDKIAGYKGAMTSETLMKTFGTNEPGIGAIFQSGMIPIGTAVKLFRGGIMLEEEIGYRFSSKIDAPLTDVAQVKAAISTIFPAIEVPLVGFASLQGVNSIDMIAANVGGYACIAGTEKPLADTDVNAITMKATLNGEDFNSGAGTDALGDQWSTLLNLVNIIVENGYTIEPGQFIISGAMGKMLPAKPGNYVVDYGDFGSISFTVEK